MTPIDWRAEFFRCLLWRFTTPHLHKFDTSTPWTVGQWTYATNGKAAIRVKDLEVQEWKPLRKRPSIHVDSLWPHESFPNSAWQLLTVPAPTFGEDNDDEAIHVPDSYVFMADYKPFCRVSMEMLSWFNSIPNCEYLLRTPPEPVLFTFPGGDGVLAPMTLEEKD